MAERPEDLNLPGSIVSRIVKDALPDGTKVSKEAQQAIAKAASVFVLYATSCSNQIAQKSNRKTIHGQDVISAMEDMEFDKFIRPLEANLEGKIHCTLCFIMSERANFKTSTCLFSITNAMTSLLLQKKFQIRLIVCSKLFFHKKLSVTASA